MIIRDRITFIVLFMGALTFCLSPVGSRPLLASSPSEKDETKKQELHKLIGQQIPDFTLKNTEGKSLNLNDYLQGQSSIVFFWATWCPNCKETLQIFNQSHQSFMDKNIKLVIINSGEEKDIVDKYLKKNSINHLNVFLDEESALDEPYGIKALPILFFVDSKGIINNVRHRLPGRKSPQSEALSKSGLKEGKQ